MKPHRADHSPVRTALRVALTSSGLGLVLVGSSTAASVAGFHSLPPCRVADTRGSAGVPLGGPALAPGPARTFSVRRLCGLPDNAIAVSFNVTITGPNGAGDLRIYPSGTTAPLASAINYTSGQTRANNGIVPLGADGGIAVQCDQASGTTHLILDVNGYFTATDEVATPEGLNVRVRPAPEVELTFDKVDQAGVTTAMVIDFPDNRSVAMDQDLKDFFSLASPLRALLPNVVVPRFVKPLGQGSAAGTPTFVLAIVDTTAKFSRTAEFHGLEDFRLGWDPPCVVAADPTQEPRTFYAREAPKAEPPLVEEGAFGGPVFVDISSGCGSNKGSGWNFSLYLTGRDTRTPHDIALYMLQQMQGALTSFASSITPVMSAALAADVQAALNTLDTDPSSSVANMTNLIGLADGTPVAFDNTARNVRGELVGRALSARYMLGKIAPPGVITEFPLPQAGSRPFGIVTGPDGNLWITEDDGNRIGRMTTAGLVTEFTVPTPFSRPLGITAGPDGNLWFVEFVGAKIGRITPAGVIAEFPTPTVGSSPWSIASGPDGNLWFTEALGGTVGRITPAGVITEFPAGNDPRGIVAGPDGNLWFADFVGNSIGRITTQGAVTLFPVPTTNSQPSGIAAGPDGNLWFTESNAYKIGRITPAGAITEFPVPTASNIFGIAAGPDGNLWFVENQSGKVGRITPAGVVSEFPIPAASNLWNITAGPDGNLWFTEYGSDKIGRISP